jgi:apolipoprotein D and lipocalin family protein
MQKIITFICILLINGCTGIAQGIKPVTGLDIKQYQGKWYEIARLDHRFERGMSSVTANYTVKPDGYVEVINRGYVDDEKRWKQAIGKAKFVGDEQIGHLKVSFFGPFYGSYVIFELDKEDYQYAYVTSYNKDYLWLLSRTPRVSKERMADFIAMSKRYGFDTNALIFMEHNNIKNP